MQWLSGRVLDSRPKGRRFEPHWRHCVVSLSKNINPSLILFQPRKTCPFITERLLMGRKESNQTNMLFGSVSEIVLWECTGHCTCSLGVYLTEYLFIGRVSDIVLGECSRHCTCSWVLYRTVYLFLGSVSDIVLGECI